MRRKKYFKLLLLALENSRVFSVGHLLTVLYISEWQEMLHDTELLNTGHYIYGNRVINTLLSYIINKTRKLALRNRKYPSGLQLGYTIICTAMIL